MGNFFPTTWYFFSNFGYFFPTFVKNWGNCENQNLDKFEKQKQMKNRNDTNQEKNVFDQNFNKNRFWMTNSQLSEPPRTLKHQKTLVKNNALIFKPQNPKNILTFLHFSCTRTDHLTWQIDRSRSQLLISFFPASLRSF